LLQARRRASAKVDLNEWSRFCGNEPARHHRFINERLEKASRREIKRLIITLPPGSAKSTYASVQFPPWFLWQRPESTILSCSCNAELATSFGRRCRNLIETQQDVLSYGLSAHSKAADLWETSNGGLYMAAGVNTKIAGRRADLGIIDDPIGSKEDADSKLYRDKQWEWFAYDFRPRLKPDAVVVLIQTRWHEEDLAGRLIAEEGLSTEGGEWTLVRIPLIAETDDPIGRSPGDYLWPEYFNEKLVSDARKNHRVFSCLYQGDPEPDEGNFFKKEWLLEYGPNDLPKELRYYCTSDHAVSERQQADLTCLLPFGVDTHGDIWILPDVCWQQMPTDETVRQMLSLMKRRRPLVWWAEREHISKSIKPFLLQQMKAEQVFVNIEDITPTRDLTSRAQSINARMSMKTVHFPSFPSWWPQARKEILAFPGGKHDDFVSALALIGLGLDRLVHANIERPKPVSEVLSYKWLKETCKRQNEKRFACGDY